MHPFAASLIALACVFGGALLGIFCRRWVPDRYKGPDSKEVVRLAMGLVVTTSAMALGLLVGSAKSFFDTQNAEMAQIAANYVMLDRILSYYGPETSDARAALRAELAYRLAESRGSDSANQAYMTIKSGDRVSETMLDTLKSLSPKDDSQRFVKGEGLKLQIQIGQTRWLMYAQNTIPFPGFLLVMLIAWLTALFVSFGIFAPRNPLVLTGMFVSATAVCGAILLILEMYHPQGGLIRISDAPLRAALAQLGK